VKKWLDSEEKPKFREISSEGVFLRSLWSQLDLLVIRDGLIYRKTSRDDTGLEKLQIIVPFSERRNILREYHDKRTAGHWV
jgi:hypothetical protein